MKKIKLGRLLERILKWVAAFILLLVTGILGSQVWRAIAEAQEPGYDAGGWEVFGVVYAMAIIIPVSSLLALFGNIKAIKSSPLRIWTLSSQVLMCGGYLVYSFVTWEGYFAIPKNPEVMSSSENTLSKQREANGYWEYFHENGALKSKGNYEDGKLEGLWGFYNENGVIRERVTYKNNLRHGAHETFYDSGELRWKRNFKNGELHGSWKTYFKNGRLGIVSNWENGTELNQTKFTYYENGQLKGRAEFKGDDFNGLREEYHENSQLKQTGSYQDGKPTGLWKLFDEEGNLTKTTEY